MNTAFRSYWHDSKGRCLTIPSVESGNDGLKEVVWTTVEESSCTVYRGRHYGTSVSGIGIRIQRLTIAY